MLLNATPSQTRLSASERRTWLHRTIHVFVDCIKASRGWLACAGHDDGDAACESAPLIRSRPLRGPARSGPATTRRAGYPAGTCRGITGSARDAWPVGPACLIRGTSTRRAELGARLPASPNLSACTRAHGVLWRANCRLNQFRRPCRGAIHWGVSMSTTDSVEGARETHAQAHARALAVWGQWLRHWRRTGAPRALHATLVCKKIASERFAAWRAELRSDRLARQSMRAARAERLLDRMLVQGGRDEQVINSAEALEVSTFHGR
jgi:hypothetical protein